MKRLFIVVLVLVLVGAGALFAAGIHSQGGSAPGLVAGRLADCPASPNCVSSESGTPEEKVVSSLPLYTWIKLADAIQGMGGTITVQKPTYIAAEFRSPTFGFVDDLECRLALDGVQLRSASRVGYSDAGVNAKRVAALREALGV